MGAVSSKSKSGKSKRVATVFTGVAAATVGMTQVANAQDVAHAAHKAASRHIARQMIPATATAIRYDSIRSASVCAYSDIGRPAIHPTWVHLWWWSAPVDTSYSECYGYKGFIISPPGFGVTGECGGNNYGSLWGFSDNGKREWHFNFHPGTTYAHLNKGSLYGVAINSWAGTDKCGLY